MLQTIGELVVLGLGVLLVFALTDENYKTTLGIVSFFAALVIVGR